MQIERIGDKSVWEITESGPNECDACGNVLEKDKHLYSSDLVSGDLYCRKCKTGENMDIADFEKYEAGR